MLSFGRKKKKEDWQTQGRAVATLKERANASLEVIICVAALLGIGTVMVYSATAGMDFSLSGGSSTPPRPVLNEFEWGAKEPAVEIQMSPGSGYRAFPISVKKAFTDN